MKKLFNNLKQLKIGTAPVDYPVFAQMVLFKDGNAFTCNNTDMAILLNSEINIDGAVNLFVLENLLKLSVGNIDSYEVEDNKLLIKNNQFITTLNISDIKFPEFNFEKQKTSIITERLLEILNKSIGFIGTDILENIFVSEEFVCATNGSKLFLSENAEYEGDTLLIPKKVLSILSIGDKISIKDNNVVVYHDDMIMMFTVDLVEDYPSDKIRSFIDSSFKSTSHLLNVNDLLTAFLKVEPVLFKETKKLVQLTTKNNSLKVEAGSINGEAEVVLDIDSDTKCEMTFDMDLMKGISGFEVFFGDEKDKLLLMSEDIKIILMGYNN